MFVIPKSNVQIEDKDTWKVVKPFWISRQEKIILNFWICEPSIKEQLEEQNCKYIWKIPLESLEEFVRLIKKWYIQNFISSSEIEKIFWRVFKYVEKNVKKSWKQ
jgi:hypothetical protein